MNISQLQDKVARQEQELEETRQQLAQASHDPATFTDELAQSCAYAFDPTTRPVEEVVKGCANSLSRYGFCVIENVIPTDEVPAIRQEILETQTRVGRNIRAIRELVDSEGLNDQELLTSDKVSLRPVRRVGRPPNHPMTSCGCRNTPVIWPTQW